MATMMCSPGSGSGVMAARPVGAGLGGCMVALVQKDCADAFAQLVVHAYAGLYQDKWVFRR
jgi:galactokinase